MNPRLLPSNFKADLLYGLSLTPFTLAKTSAEAKACDVAAQLKNKQVCKLLSYYKFKEYFLGKL